MMAPAVAKRTSRALVGLTAALTLAAAVLAALTDNGPGSTVVISLIVTVLATGYAVLGSLIVSRQPGNAIGWGFIGVGIMVGFSGFGVAVAVLVLRSNPDAPLGLVAAWLSNWSYVPAIFAIPWLFLLFPDGHLPTARWRPVAWTLGIASLVAVSALALQPDPTLNNLLDYHLRIPNSLALPFAWLGTLQGIAGITILPCAILSVVALRRRAKHATPEVRQQVRWLKAVATTAGVFLALGVLLTIVPFAKGGFPIFPIVLILFVVVLALGGDVVECLQRFSQDVEAAVYFSCLEALQNVAKYAEASNVDIELSDDDGSVRFLVRDDGSGFDPAAAGYGTGLQGMADRLAALGGELNIVSAPGLGTSLRGVVPAAAQ